MAGVTRLPWICLACLPLAAACGSDAADPTVTREDRRSPQTASSPASSRIALVEITGQVGLDYRHHAGSQEEYPMAAVMGGGAAVFDYDGDGDLDLYFVDYGESANERSEA